MKRERESNGERDADEENKRKSRIVKVKGG